MRPTRPEIGAVLKVVNDDRSGQTRDRGRGTQRRRLSGKVGQAPVVLVRQADDDETLQARSMIQGFATRWHSFLRNTRGAASPRMDTTHGSYIRSQSKPSTDFVIVVPADRVSAIVVLSPSSGPWLLSRQRSASRGCRWRPSRCRGWRGDAVGGGRLWRGVGAAALARCGRDRIMNDRAGDLLRVVRVRIHHLGVVGDPRLALDSGMFTTWPEARAVLRHSDAFHACMPSRQA